MRANVADLRKTPDSIKIEQNIPIPYTGKDGHGLECTFHGDAVILLVLSEMLIGDSAVMPLGINLQDIQRCALATFPLIFTYHRLSDSMMVRVWRIK